MLKLLRAKILKNNTYGLLRLWEFERIKVVNDIISDVLEHVAGLTKAEFEALITEENELRTKTVKPKIKIRATSKR
jgi:hypothetical protein